MADDTLIRLAATIAARRSADAGNSYTKSLLDGGPARCARKLGEEAVETVIAGVSEPDGKVRAEAADLLYHLLVLLEARRIPLASVLEELETRMQQSGLAEKSSRSTGSHAA